MSIINSNPPLLRCWRQPKQVIAPDMGNGLSRRRVLKAIAAGAGHALVPASMLSPAIAAGASGYEDGLPRSSPGDANVNPRIVLDFIDTAFANNLNLHSFMLYRHGNVVAEGWNWPYASHRPHIMHSLTKSVTACGVGLAIDNGHFSLEDRIVSFFDDDLPTDLNDNLGRMTVRDLLTMQSGHAISVSGSEFRPIRTSWVAEFFKIPVAHKPGTFFMYSSAVSFMLSAIVTRTTGESVRDYLEPRMFQPLGISGLTWNASPNGISSGGNGLTWRTADSLKLGILHLNKGRWDSQQLLSREWADQATSLQVPGSNYGYQWWIDEGSQAFYAEGAFGQFSIVFPNHDAVLAITAGIPRGAPFEQLIFEHFPAAFGNENYTPSATVTRALENRIENWQLLPEARHTTSPLLPNISGRTYAIEPNEDNVTAVTLEFSNDAVDFRISDHRGDHLVRTGLSDWIESETGITGNKLHHQYQDDAMKVVAHGLWWDEHTFEMTWQFVETAWVDRVVCRFDEDRISIDRRTNANYAPLVAATLRGEAL